jgi:hypothetical protein
MKTKPFATLAALLVLLLLAVGDSQAGVSWSVNIFTGPLGSCGYWINDPTYGHCWRPSYVAGNWYPYCDGYWMWTDSGWYWVSSEPWAWATYHYGRWANDPYYGWVWVPDAVWGPSWVCWREGGGYCGWAPLPPGAVFGPAGEIVFRAGPPPDRFFMFVDIGHFGDPIRRRDVIINNTTIINKTVNITKITRVNNRVVNNGPRLDEVQKFSSRKFTEALPRAALERGAAARPRAASPEAVKPNAGGQVREPEAVRAGAGQGGYGRKPPANAAPEKPATGGEKHSTQPRHYQNFGAGASSPYSPTAPDSIHPRQHAAQPPPSPGQTPRENRGAEKQSQSRPEQGREENPKRGQQGGQ